MNGMTDLAGADADGVLERIGSFKTDYEQASQACASLEQAVSRTEAQMSPLTAQIGSLEGNLSDLNNEIAVLEEQISHLETDGVSEEEAEEYQQVTAQLAEKQLQKQELTVQKAEAEGTLAVLQETLTGLRQNLQAANMGKQMAYAAWGPFAGSYDMLVSANEEIKTNKALLEAGQARSDSAKAELEAGQQQSDDGFAQLDAAQRQIDLQKPALEEAKEQLEAGQAEYEAGVAKIKDARRELEDGKEKLEEARQDIADAQTEIADAKEQIADGEKKIAEGWQELSDAEAELADAKKELEDGKKELADGKIEYEDGKREAEEEIADAEQKIADAEKELADLEHPEWMVEDRGVLPEYIGYGDNAQRIANIGKVFPALFFLIAALICLTTMTRMVEEERTQIGTLKALGYGKFDVASKYLKYAVFATIGGSIVGVLIGEKVLPYVIINAYGTMYAHMDQIALPYQIKHALVATGLALLSTVGATWSACSKSMEDTPAVLMRPPAPKEGKRVLLERIPFVWNRLSFSWKSTIRNLMRYKKRVVMTVFGISACMGMLILGYGLSDSILGIGQIQYEPLQH